MTWDAKNVIARGPTTDVSATQSGGATLAMTLTNSNYLTEVTSGGATVTPSTDPSNQEASPVFVNAGAGNFHQDPSSPTIDAGTEANLLGTTDFDGDPRSLDGNCDGTAAPDIGVDEFNVPCNDDFVDGQVLSGSTASVNGSNVNATEEATEPAYCTEDVCGNNVTVTRSVWYRWTAPGDGPATVDVCTGNTFDTILAVFTGPGLGSLNLVGANNNNADCPPGSFASKVSFTATQGTTYQILVDGCCGLPAGTFTLNLSGPQAPPDPGGGGGGGGDGATDTTPPDTTITDGPSSKTKKKSATIAFSGTDARVVASFQCKLDGGSFEPCAAPKTYSGLKKGAHTVAVRAVDAAGNVDPTPATRTWRIKKKRRK
jgi:hypothetical protein